MHPNPPCEFAVVAVCDEEEPQSPWSRCNFLLCTSFRCPVSFTAFVAGSGSCDIATAIEGKENDDDTEVA